MFDFGTLDDAQVAADAADAAPAQQETAERGPQPHDGAPPATDESQQTAPLQEAMTEEAPTGQVEVASNAEADAPCGPISAEAEAMEGSATDRDAAQASADDVEEVVVDHDHQVVEARLSPGDVQTLTRYDRMNFEFGQIPLIRLLADRFQVQPLAVAGACSFASLGFLLYGIGGALVCTVFGFAHPAFESFKMIEDFANMADPADMYARAAAMQFWLTYWIVVAMFTSVESLLYYALVWVPFYYPLKLTFLLWLQMPSTRGANHVYHWFVSPILRRNRAQLDMAFEESGRQLSDTGCRLTKKASVALMDQAKSTAIGAKVTAGSGLRRFTRAVTYGGGEGLDMARIVLTHAVARRRRTSAEADVGVVG